MRAVLYFDRVKGATTETLRDLMNVEGVTGVSLEVQTVPLAIGQYQDRLVTDKTLVIHYEGQKLGDLEFLLQEAGVQWT